MPTCFKKYFSALLFAGTVLLIPACATTTVSDSNERGAETNDKLSDLQSIYSRLEKTDGKVFALDPALSAIKIYAFRGGAAPTLGHNHILTSPQFSGFLFLPNNGISNARFDLEFRLDQLVLDNLDERSKLGEAFASIPTQGDIARTRDHMLGNDNLQADRFPFVRIHSLHVFGAVPKLAVDIQVELHGQTQKMTLPISVEGLPSLLCATGSFVIRQSDFGIKPYSVLGGFLAVQNELVIEFSLVGK